MTASQQDSIGPYYTPFNDGDTDVDRTCAELRIYPGDMHPSQVTGLLGISPTHVVAVGEPGATNSLGRSPVGKVNGWFLSSEEYVKSKDVRRHLNWLIGKLRQSPDAIRTLQGKLGVQMYVFCAFWTKYGDGSATLWPEQMRALADLNLECTFAFANYSKNEGPPRVPVR